MCKLFFCALLSVFFTTAVYAFQISDLSGYQSVAIKQMKKTDTKANKNRQIMGTQVLVATLGTQKHDFQATYSYVGKDIACHTAKVNWNYFCPPSWNGRCKGHINYAANSVMDAAEIGDLLLVGKKNDTLLDIVVIQQGDPIIPEIYSFMGIEKSGEPAQKKQPSFFARLFGTTTPAPAQPTDDVVESAPDDTPVDFANVDWTRLDLAIYKNNKTRKKIFEGRPTKISDGDTIVLAEIIKIRMEGIDAPESKQTCINDKGVEYSCGKLATEHLHKIIGKGKVRCEMHSYDRYGRYLMTCYKMDGTDIHAQMIKDGYAVVSTYGPETYLAQEKYAIQNKLGFHKGKFRHPHCFRHQKKQDWTVKGLCEGNKYYPGWEKLGIKSK